MANLIISVIAIALVALAALMGIYYGGNAYVSKQGQIQANVLMNMGTQVKNAIQNYLADNSNVLPTSWAELTNGGYLSQKLDFPVLPGNNNGLDSGVSVDGSGTYWLWGDIGTPGQKLPDLVCQNILQLARGAVPSPVPSSGVNHAILTGTTAGNGSFGCVINNSNMNDATAASVGPVDGPNMFDGYAQSGNYAFFYRLN
jgi:hypothetical protein